LPILPKPKKPSQPLGVRVGKRVYPITAIPKILWPDTWYDNAYYKSHPQRYQLEHIIIKFQRDRYTRQLTIFEVKMFAQYIIDFAGLVASIAYLKSDNIDRQSILIGNGAMMQKLRDGFKYATTADDIQKMLDLCKEFNIFPL
jgi:hypothetical protein